ncbi:ABC transporter G family member 12 [Pyrus ussuriensis x Pyrus communis]|uniref:ABC transporter G family member 12 n=1 Tax=Pyrus ussuriensis x Pyrus communis TaxID=2448454 RepID=A0A5N5HA90_9ROSA|nr:ABC transporter G family member 12 [Pyrus ussuriensis x Pyrus communis]
MESRRSCFTITSIKGIGKCFIDIIYKKVDVDMNKKAGESLTGSSTERTTRISLMMVIASLVPNFPMGIITFEHPDDHLEFLLLLPDFPRPFGIPVDHSEWWDLAAIPMWSSTVLRPLCVWTEICGP